MVPEHTDESTSGSIQRSHGASGFLPWLLLAFVVRAIYLISHGGIVSDDSASYLRIANNLATHGAYSLDPAGAVPTIRFAPIYPVVLAGLQLVGLTPVVAVVWLQIVADALAAGLVWVLASRVAPRRWANAAAALYALHPGAIMASVSVLTETLFTALVLTAATCIATRRGAFHGPRLAVAGALLAVAALCRPIGMLYIAVFAGVLAMTFRPAAVARAMLLVATSAIVIAPWSWRSSVLAGQLVPIQAAGPVLFYVPTRMDWDQRDQAALWPAFAQDEAYGRLFAQARSPREMVAADAVGRRLILQNIRERPVAYLRARAKAIPYLVLTSFDSFFGRSKAFGTALAERDWISLAAKLTAMVVFCIVPLVLAAAGAARRPHSETSALALALWTTTFLVHLPMWIEPRFWLPVVPFVLITAAHAGARRRVEGRIQKRDGAGLAV